MTQVIILGIVSFLVDVSSEMVYPLLPVYLTRVLHADVAILGVIEGIAESAASFLKLASGYVSDRLKKRKALAIFGYGFSWLGKILFYFAGGWQMIFSGRLLDRMGKGIRTSPRDALIADHTPEKKRGAAYGLHRSLDTLGAFLGVLIVLSFASHGLFDSDNAGLYKKVFLYSLIPGIAGWLLLFAVKEKRRIALKKPVISLSLRKFPWKLRAFLIFSFVFALGNSSNQFLLLRVQEKTGSLRAMLLAYLAYNLTYGLLAYPCGKISDRVGQKRVLIAGYFIYGIVYWAFASGKTEMNFFISTLALYGFYMALTDGVEKSLVSRLAPEDIRGSVLGAHSALVGIGLLPASIIAGVLWKAFGPSAAFGFGGTVGFLAAFGLLFIL